jgi:hypothetical protein
MLADIAYLHGKRLCVVFVKVIDEDTGKVQLQCLHGRANVEAGRLKLMTPEGAAFGVPGSALANILPSDGTPMLRDAEYFVLVKADRRIDFLAGGDEIRVG